MRQDYKREGHVRVGVNYNGCGSINVNLVWDTKDPTMDTGVASIVFDGYVLIKVYVLGPEGSTMDTGVTSIADNGYGMININ